MITAIVRFKLPQSVKLPDAVELFQGSAPKYRALPGLVRKYYLFDENGGAGGGIYLWENKEAAERVYTAEWRQMIQERYGAEPEVTYFHTPVIVDNTTDQTQVTAE